MPLDRQLSVPAGDATPGTFVLVPRRAIRRARSAQGYAGGAKPEHARPDLAGPGAG